MRWNEVGFCGVSFQRPTSQMFILLKAQSFLSLIHMLPYHEVRGKHAQAEFYNCYFNICVEKRIISCR